MRKKCDLFRFLLGFCLVSLPTFAAANRSSLVDRVCLIVEGETPVLFSHIKNWALQNEISFREAEEQLKRKKLLWVYAKKKLKYNVSDIYKQADEHINKIIESNKLTKDQFSQLLMKPPYSTTFSQYRLDAATALLENVVRSTIASQISINENDLKAELSKERLELANRYDMVFLSVVADKLSNKVNEKGRAANQLTPEIKKANEIRSQIGPHSSLNEIKKRYGGDKHISIIGPIAYEKGTLKKAYEDRLLADPKSIVTAPFIDNGLVTMIWKIKRPVSEKLDDKALLEKVRKKLYEAAVEKQFNIETSAPIDDATIIVKGCKDR